MNSGFREEGRSINPTFFAGLYYHRLATSLLIWNTGEGIYLTGMM